MEPEPGLNRNSRRVPGIILIVLLLILGGGVAWIARKKSPGILDTSGSQATPLTSEVTDLPSAPYSPGPVINRTGQIALAVAKGQPGELQYIYFDTKTQKVVETSTTGVEVQLGGGVNDNPHVQFADTGDSFVYTSLLGGMDDEADQFSQIVHYPSKAIILRTTEKDGLFTQWVVTKDGKTLYYAIQKNLEEAVVYPEFDVYALDIASKTKSRVATIGPISGMMHLTPDESKIYVTEERPRKEATYEYRDYYLRTLDIGKKTVTEVLFWKGRQPSPFPFWSVASLEVGPKQMKAVGTYELDGKYTLREVTIATQAEKDLVDFGGPGQEGEAQWSADGMKVLFTVRSFGKTLPAAQGVVLYDFATGKSTQVLKSTIVYTDSPSGEMFLAPGSFDGTSFIYRVEKKVYYHDIALGKSTEIATSENLGDVFIAKRF